jgi:small GTP-binding protein
MAEEKFELGEMVAAAAALRDELRRALAASTDPAVTALLGELDALPRHGDLADAPPLRIGFVGQYNAGKSTILRVLTGRTDIVIDSNVSTDKVAAYDWNGVELLDTPGIHAGRHEHDETTYAAIDRADLLVFVVTNELFDHTLGHHFRQLAFHRQHAGRMLLVVNKMGQDPGTPADKRPDLEKVTAPLGLDDFATVFIDARSWLEAQSEEDARYRDELLELANLPALIAGLNRFVRDRGLTGRLTTPLFGLRGLAEQAAALSSTDHPEERAALELLHRKRNILLASRQRLRATLRGLIARGIGDIGKIGDDVAEAIEPGKTEQDVLFMHETAQQRAEARVERLQTEIHAGVVADLDEVKRQLGVLHEGALARDLRARIAARGETSTSGLLDKLDGPIWNGQAQDHTRADWPTRARKLGNVAGKLGSWTSKLATGPLSKVAGAGTATAARGSQAQEIVLAVGEFVGVKFKPWGAVKVARAIGKAGRVIGVIGGVLAVAGQIAEDHENEKMRVQLRDARSEVRAAYRESALGVREVLEERVEQFLSSFYSAELAAIEETVDDLTGTHKARTASVEAFEQLANRTAALLAGAPRASGGRSS